MTNITDHAVTKRCSVCKRELPLADFHRKRVGKYGRASWCRDCTRKYHRRRYLVNQDEIKKRTQRWYHKNKDRWAVYAKCRDAKHPMARTVRCQINNRVISGTIKRQPCEICGAAMADGHHDDYNEPLDVRWLCRSCHMCLHADIRRARTDEVKTCM